MTGTKRYHHGHVFHFEEECQRIDAPKENVGEWLEQQAVELTSRQTGRQWSVVRSFLERQESGNHLHYVFLESWD